MTTGLSEFAAVALAAIVLGFFALALLVHRELGPFAGLDTGGKWLLTLAFGLGLCAFSLKLVVALLIGGMAQPSLAALVASAPRPEVGETLGEFINPAPRHPVRYVWEALPDRAPEPPDNPGTPEKDRPGPPPLPGKATVRRRHPGLRHLPRPRGPGGGRRTTNGPGHRRTTRGAQYSHGMECRLPIRALLGRPLPPPWRTRPVAPFSIPWRWASLPPGRLSGA